MRLLLTIQTIVMWLAILVFSTGSRMGQTPENYRRIANNCENEGFGGGNDFQAINTGLGR